VLDIAAINRALFQAELESVVLGRIVRAGDLDSTDNVEVVLSPVSNRSRDDSDIDDVDTTGKETAYERLVQSLAARTIIPANRDRPFDALLGE